MRPSPDDLASLLSPPEWLLEVEVRKPEETAFADAIFHVSNGYQGLRVTADMDSKHCDPGFFATDVYDVGVSVNREIVNLPNPLGARVRHGYELLVSADRTHRVLDMHSGLAYMDRILCDEHGAEVRMTTLTAAHATRPHTGFLIGALRVPGDWSMVALELFWDNRTGNPYLGGTVPQLSMAHVEVEGVHRAGRLLELDCRLAGTAERLRLASTTDCPQEVRRLIFEEAKRWGHTVVAKPSGTGGLVHFAVVWSVGTAAEPAGIPEQHDAWALLEEHRAEWNRRWAEYGIEIAGDDLAREAMRFDLFQLLQHELPARRRKITPARGLSSGYHSGATFFDTELHKDAYWAWTVPEVAASHLTFRYETLAEARAFAERTGFGGARFPEAANDLGRENGPHKVLDYPEHEDVAEWSVREVLHNSADVAYAVHRYHRVTGDDDFMAQKGAELVLETARFAASVFRWDAERQGFVTRSVMGPDEYHYHVDNNHFTNYLLGWNIRYALSLIKGEAGVDPDTVGEVSRRMGLTGAEKRHWETVTGLVHLPPRLHDGIPAQHEGFERLPDCTPRTDPEGPMARLTSSEVHLAASLADFPTKLIKQADIILLMHLFPEAFDEETIRKTFAYYEPRTAHESSLSAAPHGVVAARLRLTDVARRFFLRAGRYNLDFNPRAHYRNGLHLSAYAGAWQILAEGFLGLEAVDRDTVRLRPRLPEGWHQIVMPLTFRNRRLRVRASQDAMTVTCRSGPALSLRIYARTYRLQAGQEVTAPCAPS